MTIGMKVRINFPNSKLDGLTGRIYQFVPNRMELLVLLDPGYGVVYINPEALVEVK